MCPRADLRLKDHLIYTPPYEACEGFARGLGRFRRLLAAFSDPTVEDFGCERARPSLPSGLPGTLLRRTPSNVKLSLVGRPTAWPEPESVCEWAPDLPRVGSPGSGWERPFSLATGS